MQKEVLLTVTVILLIIGALFLATRESNEICKSSETAGLNLSFEETDEGFPVNWAFFPRPESQESFQVSLDTSKAKDGRYSLMLVIKQKEITPGFRSRRIPVQSGKQYKLSFWVQNQGCAFKVKRLFQDGVGKTNLNSTVMAEGTVDMDQWNKFEETLIVPDKASNLVLIFLVNGPGTWWCDHVVVEEISQ